MYRCDFFGGADAQRIATVEHDPLWSCYVPSVASARTTTSTEAPTTSTEAPTMSTEAPTTSTEAPTTTPMGLAASPRVSVNLTFSEFKEHAARVRRGLTMSDVTINRLVNSVAAATKRGEPRSKAGPV